MSRGISYTLESGRKEREKCPEMLFLMLRVMYYVLSVTAYCRDVWRQIWHIVSRNELPAFDRYSVFDGNRPSLVSRHVVKDRGATIMHLVLKVVIIARV